MSFGYIYKIIFPNGKHYIGQTTTSLKQREKEHRKCANQGDTKCLYAALRKYDMVDTFELIEIDTADTLEELCEKEIKYILEYNSYYQNKNGYNMTFGGEGTNGYIFTEEDKQRASEKTKKYFEIPENRQKQSDSLKKYFEDNPEAREQLSKTKKKYVEDNPDVRKQMSEIQKKRFENLHEREKQSEKTKKYFEDNPEARENASKITTNYFENPENKKKHSERRKKYFEDNPDAGKEHSKRLKKYYENPEAIQKNRDRMMKHYKDNPEAKQKILDKKGKNKPFDMFTIDGTFIKTFNYQFEAKEYLKQEYHITSIIKISEVLSGKRNHSAGFVFKYK
jgi:hypothetical protein